MRAKIAVASCLFALLAGTLALPAVSQSVASPYTTGSRYDNAQRLVGTILPDPDGAGPLAHRATRNTYDSRGLLTKVEEGELAAWQGDHVAPADWVGFTVLRVLATEYDIWGRKTTETISPGGASVSQPAQLTQFSYDTEGRLECTAVRMNPAAYDALPSSACALGQEGNQGPDRITRVTYDALSRPLKVQKAVGTPIQIDYKTDTYYANGPLQSTTDANGNKSTFAYDGLQRLEYLYFPSKEVRNTHSTTDYERYTYDGNGNRTSVRKRDGRTIAYGYDNLNRQVSEVFGTGLEEKVYSGYDLHNNKLYSRFGAHTGLGITDDYDLAGFRYATSNTLLGVRGLTVTFQRDQEGRRIQRTDPGLRSGWFYDYDGLGRLLRIREGASATIIHVEYDQLGQRRYLRRGAESSGSAVTQTAYLQDGVGRLTSLATNFAGTVHDETRILAYNAANQIVTRTLSNGLFVFNEATTSTAAYAVNGLNQYTSITSGAAIAPTYDANGNMTSDGATTYTYDVLNRLTSATGLTNVTLSYDPRGRLKQTSGPSGVINYVYDGDSLIAEYSSSNAVLRRYVHGSDEDEPLVVYEGAGVGSSTRRFLHADHQGSVSAETDSAGTALRINTYDSYGVPASTNSTRFQYTGQTRLPDLGLYYFKARVYNPVLGRFMQTDPVGYQDDMGLYTYVGNDPLNHTDPDGRIAKLLVSTYKFIKSGGDIASTVSGLVDNARTLASPTASLAEKAAAVASIALDLTTGINVKDVQTAKNAVEGLTARVVEKTASGGRREDYTSAAKTAAKNENRAANDGQLTCEDCGKALIEVANAKGVPTPDNQAHVHHDQPIYLGGTKDTKKVILCPHCHAERHRQIREERKRKGLK